MQSALTASFLLLAAPHAEALTVWAHCDGVGNPGLTKTDAGTYFMFVGEDGKTSDCQLSGDTLTCDYDNKPMQIEFVSADTVVIDGLVYGDIGDKACDE